MLRNLFIRLFRHHDEEFTVVIALLLFSFFMGIAITFFFTVAISSFLISFTGKALPYAYLLSGLLSYIVWAVYQRLGSRLMFSRLVITALIFLLLVLTFLTILSALYQHAWLSMAQLAWVPSLLFLKNVCFWGMASKLFNISQGKRLFGMISSGEVLSNIIGFFSVPFLLRVLSTTGLLVFAIGGILLTLVITFFLTWKYAQRLSIKNVQGPAGKHTKEGGPRQKDPFFRLLLIFSILPVFVFYLIDFVFLNLAQSEFNNVALLATFMGYFLGAISITELFFKSVVFSRILQHYGVKAGVLCLSLALLFSTVLASLAGIWGKDTYLFFSIIALSKLLERSISNGIHAPSVQLLYQPIPTANRTGFQSKVEGISGALGNIAAGGMILLISALNISDITVYNYIILLVLAGWIFLTTPLYKAYKQKLHNALQRKNYGPVAAKRIVSGKDVFTKGLNARNTEMAMASIRLLKELELQAGIDRPLRDSSSSEILVRIENDLSHNLTDPDASGKNAGLQKDLDDLELLFSRTHSLPLKLRILEAYCKAGTERSKELLLNKLDYPERDVRMSSVKYLYLLSYTASPETRYDIKQKVTEVVSTITWLNASILDLEKYANAKFLVRSLRAEKKEYLVMLYMLLSFLYGYATIELIKNNLADKNDTEGFIYALEVAATTFEDDMKTLVFPLFENISPEKSIEKLNHFFPQKKLPVEERTVAVLYKDYSQITLWTKANALTVLADFSSLEEARQEIIGCLFHESAVLQEISLRLLITQWPADLHRIPIPLSKLKALQPDRLPDKSVFDKVLLLKEIPLFHVCPEHKLLTLAALFDHKTFYAGTRSPTQGHCIVVLSGTLHLCNDQDSKAVKPFYTFIHEVNPNTKVDYALAEEDCNVLVCNKRPLLQHLLEEPVLSRSLLKYISELTEF